MAYARVCDKCGTVKGVIDNWSKPSGWIELCKEGKIPLLVCPACCCEPTKNLVKLMKPLPKDKE
jgi:hypothetical protein